LRIVENRRRGAAGIQIKLPPKGKYMEKLLKQIDKLQGSINQKRPLDPQSLLLQAGCLETIIPPIERGGCITAFVKSQVEPKADVPFKKLIAEMVLESQKDYLRMLNT